MIEGIQAALGLGIAFLFAVGPTALIFATARRVIRPRGFLPTVKLTVAAVLLAFVVGVVFGVEVSGGLIARAIYLGFASPIIALIMVALWFLLARRFTRRAGDKSDTEAIE